MERSISPTTCLKLERLECPGVAVYVDVAVAVAVVAAVEAFASVAVGESC